MASDAINTLIESRTLKKLVQKVVSLPKHLGGGLIQRADLYTSKCGISRWNAYKLL